MSELNRPNEVRTNETVLDSGVYRCERCEKTEMTFEKWEKATACNHCGEVTWVFVRPLQPFAW